MTVSATRQLSTRLDREWTHLTGRSAVLRRVRSWGVTDARFGSLDDLVVLAGHRTAGGAAAPDSAAVARADAVLGRLLLLAPTEPVAARVVLQRILPGLMAIVRSEQQRDGGTDAMSELVAEAWMVITRPRAATLTSNVAARLLNEARHRAFVRPRRRRRVVEEYGVEVDVPVPVHSSSFDEVVVVLTEARQGGLVDGYLDVVRGLLDHGTSRRLAAAAGVTARTVYNRKRDAVDRIRRCALTAA